MSVMQLYPLCRPRSLKGLYLELALHRQSGDIRIYANYIASLDGRISLLDAKSGEQQLPPDVANRRDWRLYQELAAQSDIMLTSARYFRQLAKGCAQDLLPVGGGEAYADLLAWRREQGMKEQPDVAVLSRSLNIPPAVLDIIGERRVLVFTGEQAADADAQVLERHGLTVIAAGARSVDGGMLRRELVKRRYRSAYIIAGPQVFRTLVRARVVDELFLTTRHVLSGGADWRSILEGELDVPVALRMLSLALDGDGSQMFMRFALEHGIESKPALS